MRVWSIPQGETLLRLKPPTPHLNHISSSSSFSQIHGNTSSAPMACFQADTLKLVAASDTAVSLWDPKDNFRFVRNIIDRLDVVWRIQFNESLLVVACQQAGSTKLFLIHMDEKNICRS